MEAKYFVLLYSKYSPNSNKLLDSLKNSRHDLTQVVPLQLVCVDNEMVRDRIMKDKTIQISSVPCILIIYNDGGVEKFEGTNAFNWVDELIQTHFPDQNQEHEQQNRQNQQDQQDRQRHNDQQDRQRHNDQQDREDKQDEQYRQERRRRQQQQQDQQDQEDQEDRRHREKRRNKQGVEIDIERGNRIIQKLDSENYSDDNKSKNKYKSKSIKNKSKRSVQSVESEGKTRIDDLSTDDDSEKVVVKTDRKLRKRVQSEVSEGRFDSIIPPKSIRQDSNNYVIDDSLFNDSQTDNRSENAGAIKVSTSPADKGKSGIMARAQELAKSRESDDKVRNNIPGLGLDNRRL
jgi:hypothetical protein